MCTTFESFRSAFFKGLTGWRAGRPPIRGQKRLENAQKFSTGFSTVFEQVFYRKAEMDKELSEVQLKFSESLSEVQHKLSNSSE